MSNRYGSQPIEVRRGKYTCRYVMTIHDCSQPSSPSGSVVGIWGRLDKQKSALGWFRCIGIWSWRSIHHVFLWERANDTKYRPNLAANRKALYQPRLKFRHLLENRKSRDDGGDTIANIESNLPSFDADPEAREAYETAHWDALNGFYNGSGMKHLRHDWDAGRAHRAEFALLTDRLLSMVGGTIGKKRESNKKVVIGIGLGKFGTSTKLTSLHTSFSAYFVGKVCEWHVYCKKKKCIYYIYVYIDNRFYVSLGTLTWLSGSWSERILYIQEVPELQEKWYASNRFHW